MFGEIRAEIASFWPRVQPTLKPRLVAERGRRVAQHLAPGQQPTPHDLDAWQEMAIGVSIPQILIDISDLMWGKGHVFPGGNTIIERFLDQLPLHPAAVMLDMNCGRGGAITHSQEQRASQCAGLTLYPDACPARAPRTEIRNYRNIPASWAGRFDVVFAPMIFAHLGDKSRMLDKIANMIRSRGHLGIIDMTIDRAHVTTAFERWLDHETVRPALATLEVLKALLGQHEFSIVRTEDVTVLYAEAIREGLARASASPWAQDHQDPHYAPLQAAVVDWSTRLAALGQGLRVHTIQAVYPPQYRDLSFVQSLQA